MKPLHATDPPAVGEFRLLGRLGAGGMGRVYLGVTRSGRPVAVKVIKPEIAADPAFRARFVREVAAARQVGGFWTASVVAADPDAPSPWLATEYVPGPSLKQAVEQTGPLPTGPVRVVAARLAEALSAIHAAGLVHRDLKPANVLLAPDGPKVIDFGIARAFLTETAGMTAVIGTPSYMAPEQIRGEALSPAADVFALGSTLVYALRGHGPFNTGAPAGIIFRVVVEEPDLDGVPAELSGVIAGCLAKDPVQRPTTGALLAALGPAAGAVVTGYGDWRPPPHDPVAALAHTVDLSGGRTDASAETGTGAPPALPPARATGTAPVPAPPAPPAPPATDAPAPPALDPPSAMVARYLFPTERFRGEWRQHRIRLWQHLSAGAGALTLLGLLAGFSSAVLNAGWFAVIPILLGIGVLGWTAKAVVSWHFRRFILTNKRVMVMHGIITRHVAVMPLPRITDLKYAQTSLGRILNFGTFVIESAGQDQALRQIPDLPNPNEIYLRIVEELYEPEAVEARSGDAEQPGPGGWPADTG